MRDLFILIAFIGLVVFAIYISEDETNKDCINDCLVNNWEYIEYRSGSYGSDKCFCKTPEEIKQIW